VVLRKSPRGLTFGEAKVLASVEGGDGKEETNSFDGSVVVGNGLTRISSQSMSEQKSSVPEKSVFVLSHGENG
jgi:hypothetical protein